MKLSSSWLAGQNIGSDDSHRDQLANYIHEELSIRVGTRISHHLDQDQIAEFSNIQDDKERLLWLQEACPKYADIVLQEEKILMQEIEASETPSRLIESWA